MDSFTVFIILFVCFAIWGAYGFLVVIKYRIGNDEIKEYSGWTVFRYGPVFWLLGLVNLINYILEYKLSKPPKKK